MGKAFVSTAFYNEFAAFTAEAQQRLYRFNENFAVSLLAEQIFD